MYELLLANVEFSSVRAGSIGGKFVPLRMLVVLIGGA